MDSIYSSGLTVNEAAGLAGIIPALVAYTDGGYAPVCFDDIRFSVAPAPSGEPGSTDYSAPGDWVFFAVTYDGTATQDNVKFYKGSQTQPVYLVSTTTIDAGQLIGGQNSSINVGCSGTGGQNSTAGYLDKFCVYTEKTAQSRGALDLPGLENVRRQHADVPELITDGLAGDTDLDGDVDDMDVGTVMANFNAGSVRDYYWADGDFDGDLDVDQNDVDIVNTNYTGDINDPSIELAVISNMIKVHMAYDVNPQQTPQADIWAARGEHEGFQIAILPTASRIAGIEVSANSLQHEISGIFSVKNISIRRVETVRVSSHIDDPWPDPLMEETVGDAVPGRPLVFWVDYDVPSDARPGLYEGSITVSAPDRPPLEVPVALHVWNFGIPAQQGLHSSCAFFRGPLRRYYGGNWDEGNDPNLRQWVDIFTEYRLSINDISHDRPPGEESKHRFVKVTKKTNGDWEFDFTQLDYFLDYAISRGMANFNLGDLDTWHFWQPFYGYDEAAGVFRVFDDLTATENEEVFDAYIQAAAEHYRSDGPRPYEKQAFFYSYDELSDTGLIQEMIDRHDTIEQIWPGLNTLTTNHPVWHPEMIGHVDIWVSKSETYDSLIEPYIDQLRALGNELWFYNTSRGSTSPYFEITEMGIDHRVWFWYTWLVEADGFLLWGSNLWPHYRYPEELDSIPTAETYDKWPNRAWDDAGWVEQGYYGGRCYQFYPTPEGPLASIRMEQIRDGIEDWESLKLLGRETSPGVWNGLIGRAENAGVSQPLIDQARNAADISTVITGITSYTRYPDELEAKRREIGAATESLVQALGCQNSPDLNGDGNVDILDLKILIEQWLGSYVNMSSDLNANGSVDLQDLACISAYWLE